MRSHTVTCHPTEVRIPPLPPAEAGTRFTDPGGMQGWVDLYVTWKPTGRKLNPRPVNRKSNAVPLSHLATQFCRWLSADCRKDRSWNQIFFSCSPATYCTDRTPWVTSSGVRLVCALTVGRVDWWGPSRTVHSRRRDSTGQNAQNVCGDLGNWWVARGMDVHVLHVHPTSSKRWS